MTVLATSASATGTLRYSVLLTTRSDLVGAAQRLRYEVFFAEVGGAPLADMSAVDNDEWDDDCDHLIVREDNSGEVVGTYRVFPPGRSAPSYSDSHFDLTPLAALRRDMVEAGRVCVHPRHRTGAVLNLLWAGIARYLDLHGLRWLGGSPAAPVESVGEVWRQVQPYLAPPQLRVTPRHPFPDVPAVVRDVTAASPSATSVPRPLRRYLRLGAWVCGPPTYDSARGIAYFFVLANLDRVDPRYLRRFGHPARRGSDARDHAATPAQGAATCECCV